MNISLSVAKAAMQILRDQPQIALSKLDISEAIYNKVKSPIPWLGGDKAQVKRCLDALIMGSLDVIGTSAFELSAEYIAAGIAMYVHPGNLLKACSWMEGAPPNSVLAVPGSVSETSVSASQLFALVIGLHGTVDCCEYRQIFELRTGLAMKKHAQKTGETLTTK